MGADKALVEVDGVPMGRRCVEVLAAVGCEPVLVVGGAAEHEVLGGRAVPDGVPGGGPAAAVATALRHAGGGATLVLPTDLPAVEAAALAPLIEAARQHPEADLVVATIDGRRQLPLGIWAPGGPTPPPGDLAGTSLRELVADLSVVEVPVDERLRDADRPTDLPDPSAAGGTSAGTGGGPPFR